jgi:Tfp pilus assembly protein PilF
VLEEAVRVAPDYADAHTQLAIVYADLGRSADAVAMAEKALELAKAAGNAPQVQFLQNWLNEHRRAN